MKVKITEKGARQNGELLKVGAIVNLNGDAVPAHLVNKCVEIGGKTAVTNPAKGAAQEPVEGLVAKHYGGGKFRVLNGDDVMLEGLSKADADAFNNMSAEDKDAYVAAEKAA